MTAQPLRLAHISDLHLLDDKTRMRLRDWLSKRAIGWANSRLTRNHLFESAPVICKHLAEMLPTRNLDGVMFTGDATMLGMSREFTLAAGIFQPLMTTIPGVAVPGNHDHYTRYGVRHRYFEETFAPWLEGRRVDKNLYPFAREFKGTWLICVNSSRPNLAPWDSRGKVGSAQLERLKALLNELPQGPKLLVTHYPYALANGHPEKRWRKLRDVNKLWHVVKDHSICWLHGHRHVRYSLTIPGSNCVEICVGSTTQAGRWTYHEYELTGNKLTLYRRGWDKDHARFEDVDREEFSVGV